MPALEALDSSRVYKWVRATSSSDFLTHLLPLRSTPILSHEIKQQRPQWEDATSFTITIIISSQFIYYAGSLETGPEDLLSCAMLLNPIGSPPASYVMAIQTRLLKVFFIWSIYLLVYASCCLLEEYTISFRAFQQLQKPW